MGHTTLEKADNLVTQHWRSSHTLLREVISKKNPLPFGHCPKEGGVQPESKSLRVVFFWAFFWTFSIEEGAGEPIPKVLGHF